MFSSLFSPSSRSSDWQPSLRHLGLALLIFINAACATADQSKGDEPNHDTPKHDQYSYDLEYIIELQPQQQRAKVTIEIANAKRLREVTFTLQPELHSQVKANGELQIKDNQAIWQPPAKNARFSLLAKITQERDSGEFDALITDDWAILRGDDLIPTASVRALKNTHSRARLEFKLPEQWPSAATGWPKQRRFNYTIDNPQRRFDRPTGWMILGKLGVRRDQVGSTELVVAAPQGDSSRRMQTLSFLTFVWPEIERAFGSVPEKILLVGAGEPMWRGGLSGPNSLFLHADRPLVSGNGTSSLLHELTHTVTRIRGDKNDDWIAEGLAEFYSVELLYRAGGITADRREKIIAWMADWGGSVKQLRKKNSTGPTTARAAVLFAQLDREIRQHTKDAKNLDHVTRKLIKLRKISLQELRDASRAVLGFKAKALNTELLN